MRLVSSLAALGKSGDALFEVGEVTSDSFLDFDARWVFEAELHRAVWLAGDFQVSAVEVPFGGDAACPSRIDAAWGDCVLVKGSTQQCYQAYCGLGVGWFPSVRQVGFVPWETGDLMGYKSGPLWFMLKMFLSGRYGRVSQHFPVRHGLEYFLDQGLDVSGCCHGHPLLASGRYFDSGIK